MWGCLLGRGLQRTSGGGKVPPRAFLHSCHLCRVGPDAGLGIPAVEMKSDLAWSKTCARRGAIRNLNERPCFLLSRGSCCGVLEPLAVAPPAQLNGATAVQGQRDSRVVTPGSETFKESVA